MKKILCLLGLLFLLTGCSNIANLTNDDIVSNILSTEGEKANEALVGYKIYIPVGMTLISDNSNNNILYSNGEKYYLYADIISYYKHEENDYKINNHSNAYYYKELEYDGKSGYVLVTERANNKYFVEIMYNYAKIEVVTSDVKTSLIKSLVVLNSLSYNDYVIDSLVGSNVLNYNDEEFTLAGPDSSNTDDFLKYEEEYISSDAPNELPEDDTIDITGENTDTQIDQ